MFTEFNEIPSGGANYTQYVSSFIRYVFNDVFSTA
jgi:hypothetical protein